LGELKSRMYSHNTAIYSIDLSINLMQIILFFQNQN
jgi:hypothetical protein